ncbi:MAG: hypothetical protein ACXW4M_00905 [Anaerolineales bacterium]
MPRYTRSRPNVVLSARLEGIEVVDSARAGVYPGECAQPHTINPSRVVVHASQGRLLNVVNPQGETAIVGPHSCCCPPIHSSQLREQIGSKEGQC